MTEQELNNEQKNIQAAMEKFIIFLINRSIKLYNNQMINDKLKHSFIHEINIKKFDLLKIDILVHQWIMIIDKSYLRNKEYEIGECKSNIIQMQDMVNHLLCKEKNNNELIQLFTDFEILSDYLMMSDLSQSEMFYIIITAIYANSSLPVFTKIKDEETYNAIYKNTKKKLEKRLSRAQKKGQIATSINIIKKLKGLDKIRDVHNSCNIVMQHYFEKQDCYDYQDVDILMKALADLKIANEVLKKVRRVLVKPLKQSKATEEIKEISFSREQNSNLLADKEYKKLKKELSTYFDFQNEKVIRKLTQQEINHCLDIFVKLGEFDKMISFLSFVDDTLERGQVKNPIAYYVIIYNKLKYYEEKLGIQERLKNIEDCLKEMFICTNEDYIFWKNQVETELNDIIQLLPTNYEYEIDQAKNRVFSQKNK